MSLTHTPDCAVYPVLQVAHLIVDPDWHVAQLDATQVLVLVSTTHDPLSSVYPVIHKSQVSASLESQRAQLDTLQFPVSA